MPGICVWAENLVDAGVEFGVYIGLDTIEVSAILGVSIVLCGLYLIFEMCIGSC